MPVVESLPLRHDCSDGMSVRYKTIDRGFAGTRETHPKGRATGGFDSCLFAQNTEHSSCIDAGPFGYVTIDRCTFARNKGVLKLVGSDADVSNTIMAFNFGEAIVCERYCFWDWDDWYCYDSRPDLSACDLFGNLDDYESECMAPFQGTNLNISDNPLFCDTASDNYTLHSLSPCVGAGEGGADIGAYGVGCGPTHTEPGDVLVPLTFYLQQNYPNPFNPSTTIEYSLASRSRVRIEVFNILGQSVCILLDEELPADSYSITWNGTDDRSRPVATGVYFYRIRAGEFVETKKMLLLK